MQHQEVGTGRRRTAGSGAEQQKGTGQFEGRPAVPLYGKRRQSVYQRNAKGG